MVSATQDKQASSPLRFMCSLRYKLFLPFLVIIILLGMAATFSSVGLLRSSLIQSADDRLVATQEMLFREFKKQEIILQTYTILLQHFVSLVKHVNDTEEVGILQDQLFTTLEEANISVAFYPSGVVAHLPQQSLVNLFDQAQRSKQPRFRYTNELGDHPVLMVAAPLYAWDKSDNIMLLHMAMGDSFLHRIANPLGVKAVLMDFEGKTIAVVVPSGSGGTATTRGGRVQQNRLRFSSSRSFSSPQWIGPVGRGTAAGGRLPRDGGP